MFGFKFKKYDKFTDGEIEVTVGEKRNAFRNKGQAPSYEFDISLKGRKDKIGTVSLRIGNTKYIENYFGHIGYGINKEYRGNRYAAKACNLIKQVAIDHGLKRLWITTNPDNYPSRRTCEILGCELVEIVEVPEDSDIFRWGDNQKCRYLWNLEES